jgi:hypothetical protein
MGMALSFSSIISTFERKDDMAMILQDTQSMMMDFEFFYLQGELTSRTSHQPTVIANAV